MRRTFVLALCAALLAPSLAGAEEDQVPIFRGDMGNSVDQCIRPVYQAFEAASDGVYDLVHDYFVAPLLPGGLRQKLTASPDGDSYAVYRRDLSAQEDRFARQMVLSYPGGPAGGGYYTAAQLSQWQGWVQEQQLSILVDSFRDTMLERHQLAGFGRSTGAYARDTSNWDPNFLAMSAIVGSVFLYFNGLHTTVAAGDLRVGVDLRAGMHVRSAVASRGDPYQLGGVELGWKNSPVTLAANWGLQDGRLYGDQYGVNYRLRY